jgi:hypothetical protein
MAPTTRPDSGTANARTTAAARAAFRQRRLATEQGRLHDFYVEHGLTEQARSCRARMLTHLRAACRHWRAVLGSTR